MSRMDEGEYNYILSSQEDEIEYSGHSEDSLSAIQVIVVSDGMALVVFLLLFFFIFRCLSVSNASRIVCA